MTQTSASIHGKELKIEICRGPRCPHCQCDTFDDWWLDGKRMHKGDGVVVSMRGSIKCHDCGKFFKFEKYVDGEFHNTAYCKKRKILR